MVPGSPDRVSARACLVDLKRACPGREWRLIEINRPASDVLEVATHIQRVLCSNDSVMDLSIAGALWLASHGAGWLGAGGGAAAVAVQSQCRVLLSGQGADELFAGYSRHRAAAMRSAKGEDVYAARAPAGSDMTTGAAAASAEPPEAEARQWGYGANQRLFAALCEDQARLWRRNLGRDDRVIGDCGKELRAPFLDRRVVAAAGRLRPEELVRPGADRGVAEKAALREVASSLGLASSAVLAKRAVQFGSRLAKQLNKAAVSKAGKVKGNDRLQI